mmetsp:Transcript_28952/g.62994  ORF Transcript_28952/g.62994 Transcript_28952/m.62994 type:complete len:240 (+) Transcript_28952:840-1559(+)
MWVVSSKRSNMFIKTVPVLVTICFRLKVLAFSLTGSKAVFKSAKGSDFCCSGSDFWAWEPARVILAFVFEATFVSASLGCSSFVPDRRRPCSGLAEATWRTSAGSSTALAMRAREFSLFSSAASRRIFSSALSILCNVPLSKVSKSTSSLPAPRSCGCCVSWRKRHRARMTCAASSTAAVEVKTFNAVGAFAVSLSFVTWSCGGTAAMAICKPSFPCRSRRSKGTSLLVVCLSMTAVIK